MSWKSWLAIVSQNAICMSAFAFFLFLVRKDWRFTSFDLIGLVIAVVAGSLGTAGATKLLRAGKRNTIRIYAACLFAFIAGYFILIYITTLGTTFSRIWTVAVLVLMALPYPLALYLNRRNRPAAQLTLSDAP
jgi:hypothetical protein